MLRPTTLYKLAKDPNIGVAQSNVGWSHIQSPSLRAFTICSTAVTTCLVHARVKAGPFTYRRNMNVHCVWTDINTSQVPMIIVFSNQSLRRKATKLTTGRLYNFTYPGRWIGIRTRELMLSKLQKDRSSSYATSTERSRLHLQAHGSCTVFQNAR
jgi:hypothetical protein